jgi:predicted nucleotide-binding protein
MVDPDAGIELLAGRIAQAEEVNNSSISMDSYLGWFFDTRECLVRIFGSEEDAIVKRFIEARSRSILTSQIRQALGIQARQLKTASDILKAEAKSGPKDARIAQEFNHGDSRKVFVVHGHNEAVKNQAARFLERIKLEPIILAEQASAGLTVIEKFEQHSEVSFAVVLLTADDRGGVKNSPPENLHLRARQNVIFELGYFVAKLGRKKVCALYEEGVEIPSDYKGVIFVSLDVGGAWRLTLAQEMRKAGLEVDMNKI